MRSSKEIDPITGNGECCPTRTRKIRADKKTKGGDEPEDKRETLESQIQDGAARTAPKNPKQLKLSFL
jgi:hypothetical protein